MITVSLKTILALKKIIGGGQMDIVIADGATVQDLVDTMVKRWGEKIARELYDLDGTKVSSQYRLMVNGQDLSALNGLSTRLNDNDEIIIFPIITGG